METRGIIPLVCHQHGEKIVHGPLQPSAALHAQVERIADVVAVCQAFFTLCLTEGKRPAVHHGNTHSVMWKDSGALGWLVKMSAQAHVDLLESCTGSLVFGGCALGLVLWIVLRTITTLQEWSGFAAGNTPSCDVRWCYTPVVL